MASKEIQLIEPVEAPEQFPDITAVADLAKPIAAQHQEQVVIEAGHLREPEMDTQHLEAQHLEPQPIEVLELQPLITAHTEVVAVALQGVVVIEVPIVLQEVAVATEVPVLPEAHQVEAIEVQGLHPVVGHQEVVVDHHLVEEDEIKNHQSKP